MLPGFVGYRDRRRSAGAISLDVGAGIRVAHPRDLLRPALKTRSEKLVKNEVGKQISEATGPTAPSRLLGWVPSLPPSAGRAATRVSEAISGPLGPVGVAIPIHPV